MGPRKSQDPSGQHPLRFGLGYERLHPPYVDMPPSDGGYHHPGGGLLILPSLPTGSAIKGPSFACAHAMPGEGGRVRSAAATAFAGPQRRNSIPAGTLEGGTEGQDWSNGEGNDGVGGATAAAIPTIVRTSQQPESAASAAWLPLRRRKRFFREQ